MMIAMWKSRGENLYLFKLAIKNINRNRGRSFFIGLSVTLSVVMAIWIVAFFDGLNHQIELAVVNGNVGYWQLQEKSFSSSTDPLNPRDWTAELQDSLKHKKILGYSPELVLDGYISDPQQSASLQVIGVDYALHAATLNIKDHIVDGKWPTNNDHGIVIGREIAEKFQYQINDQIVINFQDANGELRSELVPILAIFRINGRSFEKRFAYTSNQLVGKLLFNKTYSDLKFHRILIMSKDLESPAKYLKEIQQKNDLSLQSWKELNPEMGVVIEFHEGLIKLFLIIIGITVTVTILTPVSMLWQERLNEIKMMNTIGIPNWKIWRMGLYEAVSMAVISGTVASMILAIIIGIQSKTGLDFRGLSEGEVMERAGIQLPEIIYPHLLIKQLVVTYLFVIIILLLSYILAVRSVTKKAQEVA
jgi:ABC-type lipoprotein release transport system permease subunit